jgi:hypothetical protein
MATTPSMTSHAEKRKKKKKKRPEHPYMNPDPAHLNSLGLIVTHNGLVAATSHEIKKIKNPKRGKTDKPN